MRKVNAYRRSEAVKVYVLRRAAGVCEACREPAPFTTVKGQPYLEPHHIRRLADGGPDHPRWVAAICPNCHRRIHHGQDGQEVNDALAHRIGELEQD
jgi:5-methylcytosine-specific restriction protein A